MDEYGNFYDEGDDRDYYTVTQAAEILGYSEGYVRRLCKSEKLTSVIKHNRIYIYPEFIERYIEKHVGEERTERNKNENEFPF